MKPKTKKKVYKLMAKIQQGINDIDKQISKGLTVHMQRVIEMECTVAELNDLLWEIQKER
jgi:hypothetical protein